MSNNNILFYSNKCTTSKNLLFVLNNEGLINMFKLVCVDNILDKIPPQITKVPTMIVSNVAKPLIAQETFKWVEQMRFLNNKNQSSTTFINKQQNQTNQVNQINNEPQEFDYFEAAGISDRYSYTDDRQTQHLYVNVGEEDKHSIFTAPLEENKFSKADQEKIVKERLLNREKQDSENVIYIQKELASKLN